MYSVHSAPCSVFSVCMHTYVRVQPADCMQYTYTEEEEESSHLELISEVYEWQC